MSLPLVTHVLWRLDRGGTERMVFELAKRLPAHGFRVRVIAAGGGGVMEEEFRQEQIPLRIGPDVGSARRGETVRFLRAEARSHHPHIWHTHLGGDIWGGMVARHAHLHPWISTVHDVQVPSLAKRLLRTYALRSADHVVCISEFVRAHLQKTYKRALPTSIIRLGVDVPFHSPKYVHHRWQRFVTIGRLVPEKRTDVIIHALALIEEPWHLDIVGDGPERGRLEALVQTLRLRARVRFVGSVSDVRPYLAEADACLFASREEGQGMVPLEAAAMGIPVVASDLPPLRELFNQDSMLFLPPSADSHAWHQVIAEAMYHPEANHERAVQAASIVREQCSIERMVKDYADLYHDLLTRYAYSPRQ